MVGFYDHEPSCSAAYDIDTIGLLFTLLYHCRVAPSRVAVVAQIGSLDHSSLSAVISMAQAVLNLCVGMKVFLKHQLIGIQFVMQCRICPGITFCLLTILLKF